MTPAPVFASLAKKALVVEQWEIDRVLTELVRTVQADALEAAARACVEPDSADKWIPERRECAEAIRKLIP